MAAFIEVHKVGEADDPILLNTNDISGIEPVSRKCTCVFMTNGFEYRIREGYQQIRPMIGRATGGITTAADVRISEVE